MKLNFGKRLVLFLHWLLSLFVCAFVAIGCIMPDFAAGIIAMINQLLGAGLAEIVGIVMIAIYALLSVLTIVFIFSRTSKRGDRGFITVDSSEAGRTRIAIGAVEQMIRQAIRGVDGIADMKSSIVNGEDAISINTSVSIISGAHVPTVTMNIQRAIRSYIELNCGVAVREVCVSVHTLASEEDSAKSGRRKSISSAPVAAYVPAAAEKAAVVETNCEESAPAQPENEVAETQAEEAEPAADNQATE